MKKFRNWRGRHPDDHESRKRISYDLPSPADSHCAFSQNVSQRFAGRPTFEQVAQKALQQAIQKRFPTSNIDLSKTKLATPDVAARRWRFQPFMRLVLDYLSLGTPLDFTPQGNFDCYLSDAPPHRLKSGDYSLDMKVIEKLVLELPVTIPIELEDALTRYWNADIDDAPKSMTAPPPTAGNGSATPCATCCISKGCNSLD
ncbi:hypothetical protein THH46_18495 [Pseudomonas sp. NA13]